MRFTCLEGNQAEEIMTSSQEKTGGISYREILNETDKDARDEYDVDREHFLNRDLGSNVPATDVKFVNTATIDHSDAIAHKSRDSNLIYSSRNDIRIVQDAPNFLKKKNIVVLDTAHRDWVKQPFPYQCSFAFNRPATTQASTISRVPIYENNKFVAINAVENSNKTPYVFNIGRNISSSVTQVIGGILQDITSYYGFTLSANGVSLRFPPYDPNRNLGRIITYDIVSNEYIENFSTRKTIPNVVSLRIAKAVLPHRTFLTFTPPLFTDATSAGTLGTFANEPYLLLQINNFQGQYSGGNDPVTRAFSVLAQDYRNFFNRNINIGNQFQDYYPWTEEAYAFNTPLSYLPDFDINLTKNTGDSYSQIDDLDVYSFSVNTGSTFSTQYTGAHLIECEVKHRLTSQELYNVNELRVGDRLRFHSNTLANLIKDPESYNRVPYVATLLRYLLTNDVLVLSNTYLTGSQAGQNPIFAKGFVFAYYPSDNGGVVQDSLLLKNLSAGINANRVILTNKYHIPAMNTNMQATFVFEIINMEPDVSMLSGQSAR